MPMKRKAARFGSQGCSGRWTLDDGRWLVAIDKCRGYWQITRDRSPHIRWDNRPRRYATFTAALDHWQRIAPDTRIAHMQHPVGRKRPICKSALPIAVLLPSLEIGKDIGGNGVEILIGADNLIVEPIWPRTHIRIALVHGARVPHLRRADLQIGRVVG